MLIVQPERVRFGTETWNGVSSVTIERKAERPIVEWSDDGPHVVLADVAEQKVVVKVTQRAETDDVGTPAPGEQAVLSLETARNASAAGRRVISMIAAVSGVSYSARGSAGLVRTVTLIAVSSDGAADPVTITAAEGG